jgi:FkbM family methyltransferase
VHSQWYRRALNNLGPVSLARLQLAKRSNAELHRLTSKTIDYSVFARAGTSDLIVFNQVFVDREYGCVDHLPDIKLIIDLGANVGYSSAYFLSRFPRSFVVAVEPDPSNFALLERNLSPYAGRYRAVQGAAWWRKEKLCFTASTVKGDEWGRAVRSGDGDVDAVTVPELLARTPFPRISILKIDIEKAERELFSHDTPWLDSVDHIVIELHNDECRDIFINRVEPWIVHKQQSGELLHCSIRRIPSYAAMLKEPMVLSLPGA